MEMVSTTIRRAAAKKLRAIPRHMSGSFGVR
jgi:hypothetical protein